ncbi:TerD family protein [Actinomadura sp. BRA 177]|uniref:TerD family protein n=1 Tax=Actinomadura sp. BRA 177 TaxID=2745202 RepID=UPI001C3C27F0|nr:TerD family protein [Actinomadura sp. BRA 177]
MGFGFRVGVPGMSVRVSSRGVRTSVGPRAARIHMGGGRRTTVSSGMGPFFASTSVGGSRRRSTAKRPTRPRNIGPTPAQLERARRQAERAEQEAQRDAAIAHLEELRRQTTSVHLQTFPQAQPPFVPQPPQLALPWALAEAQAFHLAGIGRFARADRATARHAAEQDAPAYLAAEQARLSDVHRQLHAAAEDWWRALTNNDEDTVCEAVNTAFSDNPAAGSAVGLDGTVLSIVMRQPDLDDLPTQTPGLTPSGRPTLKTMTKRDRLLWWLTSMGSNVVATLNEAFATAPGITAIDLAVLTRMPDTQRLGIVAYGQWTRQAVQRTPWSRPEDALRFLDIAEDVDCSVRTTASGNLSTSVKPLDTTKIPGLEALLAQIEDVPEAPPEPTTPPPSDPYALKSFAEWKQTTAPAPPSQPQPAAPANSFRPAPQPQPAAPAHSFNAPPPQPTPPQHAAPVHPSNTPPAQSAAPHSGAPQPAMMQGTVPQVAAHDDLSPGQTLVLPDEALQGLLIAFAFTGADADLTLLLLDDSGKVRGDEDFVFYHQPTAAGGAARLLGKQPEGQVMTERAGLHLSALPEDVHRVAVSINMDVDTGLTCAALTYAALHMRCITGTTWTFRPPPDPSISAMLMAEFYRHTVNGHPAWKLRALGQGWSDGLGGLARAHGVDVT